MEKRYVVAGAYPVLSSDSLSEPSAVWVTGKMGALKRTVDGGWVFLDADGSPPLPDHTARMRVNHLRRSSRGGERNNEELKLKVFLGRRLRLWRCRARNGPGLKSLR